MKFSFTVQRPDLAKNSNLIRAYTMQEITVRDQVITHSVLLSAEEIVTDWPPQSTDALSAEHVEAALKLAPEVILLGTGQHQQFPDVQVLLPAYRAGVGVEVMDTPAACRTFNILVQEGRRVVAALILES